MFWREAAIWAGVVAGALGVFLLSGWVFGGFGTTLTPTLGIGFLLLSLITILFANRFTKARTVGVLVISVVGASYLWGVGDGSGLSVVAIILFFWIDLIAFGFLRRVEAVTLLGLIALSDAVSTWLRPDFSYPGLLVVATLVALGLIGLFTSRLVQRLAQLAYVDELTRLPNRRYLQAVLRRELASASRTSRPLSIALIDLDGFKAINDEQGHLAGDQVLSQVAHEWSKELRSTDFIARYGGDEFLVVLPGTPEEEAAQVVSRIVRRTSPMIGASFGTALWDRGESTAALIDRADARLYRHKRADETARPTSTDPPSVIDLSASNAPVETAKELGHP
jgi:diguanylate cyclase (GGDEF)-like protein